MSDPSGLSGTHEQQLPAWADPSVSPADLDAQGVSRRGLLRGAGLFGAAFAMGPTGALTAPASAQSRPYGGEDPRLAYLVGDHHIHTVYSHDAKYTFSQLAAAGAKYGLDWMVFTEHSNFGHADFGAALEHKEILKARAENPRQLIFQGLEWYIPAAEHCTVFTTPAYTRWTCSPASSATTTASCWATRTVPWAARTPPATRRTPSGRSSGWPSSAARDTWTTCWCWPTTPCASASTPRTRCAPGGTRPPRS